MQNLHRLLLLISMLKSVYLKCPENCLKCNKDLECQLCDISRFYRLTPERKCIPVEIKNCLEMNPNSECIRCKQNLYPQDSSCVPIESELQVENKECLIWGKDQTCKQCTKGYYVEGVLCKRLEEIIPNCERQSSKTVCLKCETGFYTNDNASQCLKLPEIENCSTYGDYKCQACNSHFILNESYYLDLNSEVNGFPQLTVQELQQLLQQDKDKQVQYKNQQVCQQTVIENCLKHQSFNQCQICEDSYYLNSKKGCSKNPKSKIKHCEQYKRGDQCKRCTQEYYLINHRCKPVNPIDNCKTYAQDVTFTKCLECKTEYFLFSKVCKLRKQNSIAGCLNYSLDGDFCQKCNEGKVGKGINTGQFLECRDAIAFCKRYEFIGEVSKCIECQQIYYREDEFTCTLGTIGDCTQYKQVDPLNVQTCLACGDKMFLNQDKNLCEKHSDIHECSRYSPDQKDTCLECNKNHFFMKMGSICNVEFNAISNCVKYDNKNQTPPDSKCSQCAQGYILEIIDEDTNASCVKMDPGLEDCLKTYDENSKSCEICKEGFGVQQEYSDEKINNNVRLCQTPFKFTQLNCSGSYLGQENSPKGAKNFSRSMKCSTCEQDSIPFDLRKHSVCVQKEEVKYLLTENPGFEKNTKCAVFSGKEQCLYCVNGYILTIDGQCDLFFNLEETCNGSGIVALGVENNNIKKNYCQKDQTTGEGIFSLDNEGEIKPIGCKKNHSMILSYMDTQFSNIHLPLSNFTKIPERWVTHLGIRNPVLKDCLKNSDEKITLENLSQQYFNEDYNCIRCKNNKSGILTADSPSSLDCSKTIKDCDPKEYRNAPIFWAKFSSCLVCTGAQTGLLFANYDTSKAENTFTLKKFTLNPEYDDWEDIKSTFPNQPSQICVDNARTTILQTLKASDEANKFELVPNCGLYLMNLAVKKLKGQLQEGTVQCAYCRPGYKPKDDLYNGDDFTKLKFVTSCEKIQNCKSDSNIINGCSECKSNYAYIKTSNILKQFQVCTKMIKGDQKINVTPNCLYLDQTQQQCLICKKGYNLTVNDTCALITNIPGCTNDKFFYDKNDLITNSYNIKNNQDIFQMFYFQEGTSGCSECQNISSYAVFIEKQAIANRFNLNHEYCLKLNQLNTEAKKISWDNPNQKFIRNCKQYGVILSEYEEDNQEVLLNSVYSCQNCDDNFILNVKHTRCHALIESPNCSVFRTEGNGCHQCELNFGIIHQDSKYQCRKNEIPNCREVVSNSEFKASQTVDCLKCDPGYYLKQNTCILGSIKHCDVAKNSPYNCEQCLQGYFKLKSTYISPRDGIDDNNRAETRDYCMQIPLTSDCAKAYFDGKKLQCSLCKVKQRVPNQISEAQKEVNMCLNFNQIPNCEEYMVETSQQGQTGQQRLDSSNFSCKKCNAKYFRVNLGYKCKQRKNLPENCLNYKLSDDKCLTCKEGYFLEGQTCIPYSNGEEGCEKYELVGEDRKCTKCNPSKYFMIDDLCERVDRPVDNCKVIKDKTRCDVCDDSYILNESKQNPESIHDNWCEPSDIINCKIYTNKENCQLCMEKFKKKTDANNRKICVAQENPHCVTYQDEKCIECQQGYYVDKKNINGDCVIVNDIIKECLRYKESEFGIMCTKCSITYALQVDGQKCVDTFEGWDKNCIEQFKGEQKTCSSCYQGFELVDGKCQEFRGLQASSKGCLLKLSGESLCKVCRFGFVMSEFGRCTQIDYGVVEVIAVTGVGALKVLLGVFLLLIN